MDTVIDRKVADARLAVARNIIAAWCRIHQKTVADIPAMADDETTARDVALLTYALKMYAELDAVTVGHELGITGGLVLSLRRYTHNKIGTHTILAKKLHTILVEADLRTARINPADRVSVSIAPGSETHSNRGISARQRKRQEGSAECWRQLEQRSDAIITAILWLLCDLDRHRVMGSSHYQEHIDARYIIYAILYHEVMGGHNCALLTRYLEKTNPASVMLGLKRVAGALQSERSSLFNQKIVMICDALRISPSTLLDI